MKTKVKLSEVIIIATLSLCIAAASIVLVFNFLDKRDVLFKISRYDEILNKDNNNSPQKRFKKLIELGFAVNQDFTGFDYGTDTEIIGDYLFFVLNGRNFLTDGATVYEDVDDLRKYEISDNKYVFDNDGKIGLKDIFGNILIEPLYDLINFAGETAVAMFMNKSIFYIYYNNSIIGECDRSIINRSVTIWHNSRFISIGLNVYDLENGFNINKPIILGEIIPDCSNYVLLSPPVEVFQILNPENNLIGYADATGILAEPMFVSGQSMISGCAQAVTKDLANVFLKYKDGKIEMTNLDEKNLSSAHILPFYQNYAVYYDYDYQRYGIIDKEFNIVVHPKFLQIADRVESGFVLDLVLNRFYSVSANDYVGGIFDSVLSYDKFYLCSLNGKYSILDLQLEPLLQECGFIGYFKSFERLIIRIDNISYLLERINANPK